MWISEGTRASSGSRSVTASRSVPVVSHGSHHAVIVLSRGERLAHALGLGRIRINVFPILVGPPFGVTTILAPPLPMPAEVTVAFLPPLDWSAQGPEAAEDDTVVTACYGEIGKVMQEALDRLRLEHPHPVASGLSKLLRRGPTPMAVPVP